MKNLVRMFACLFVITTMHAQEKNEITTTMLTISELITHVADAYPAATPQQIFILVEVDAVGLQSDMRFYLEQGLGLLCKRLQPEDRIAIGTYGGMNKIVLPYTAVNALGDVKKTLQQLMVLNDVGTGDGIDMAFQSAEKTFNPKAENKVLMLRNDLTTAGLTTRAVPSKKVKNQTSEAPAPKSSNLGGAIALTALSILPEILEVIKN